MDKSFLGLLLLNPQFLIKGILEMYTWTFIFSKRSTPSSRWLVGKVVVGLAAHTAQSWKKRRARAIADKEHESGTADLGSYDFPLTSSPLAIGTGGPASSKAGIHIN